LQKDLEHAGVVVGIRPPSRVGGQELGEREAIDVGGAIHIAAPTEVHAVVGLGIKRRTVVGSFGDPIGSEQRVTETVNGTVVFADAFVHRQAEVEFDRDRQIRQ